MRTQHVHGHRISSCRALEDEDGEGCSSSSTSSIATISSSSSSSSDPPTSLAHLPNQLLLHAWQQLDQRTCYGIIPRVNRLWDQLSPTTLTSLSLTFTSATSPHYFTRWLLNHPQAPLQHLSLDFKYLQVSPHTTRELVQAICTSAATSQLSSLHLSDLRTLSSSHTSAISSLASLSSLRIAHCDVVTEVLGPLQNLMYLKTLDISHNRLWGLAQMLPFLSSAMQQLEVLDIAGSGLRVQDLHLAASEAYGK